ncbi:MAG TPA: hypothetical protein VK356_11560 [Thermomicrobiales bacterium]|nr:hypothetical protein [Thermomicrobiales bacterium]
MVWKRLFGKPTDTDSQPAPPVVPEADASGIVRRRPRAVDPSMQSRLDTLRQRRDMAAYDLERAVTARQPENPWRERMDLLDRSLVTIEDDLRTLDTTPPLPPIALPETPITDIEVRLEEPVTIAFTIGPEHFRWEEEVDWDQRGGPVVRGQVRQRSGNAAALVPSDIPAERREALERHLNESVSVFALDLRDRALEGKPLPEHATLGDLARPCPVCGDWLDWRGHCDTCATRAYRRQTLRGEAARLAQERDDEEEDRHKWSERFPVARRRLADLDAEIAKLEAG